MWLHRTERVITDILRLLEKSYLLPVPPKHTYSTHSLPSVAAANALWVFRAILTSHAVNVEVESSG